MKGQVKKSGLVFAALKAGQQILHDLDSVVLNNSRTDLARYATEQYVCKIGSTAVLAYTLDKASSYLEDITLPKFIRGLLPITAATIGAGAAIHYGGEYMNMQAGTNLIETTTQLLQNYQENISKLISLNPNLNQGYLIGAFITAKSGLRWIKNIGESIADSSEKKKQRQELQEFNEN